MPERVFGVGLVRPMVAALQKPSSNGGATASADRRNHHCRMVHFAEEQRRLDATSDNLTHREPKSPMIAPPANVDCKPLQLKNAGCSRTNFQSGRSLSTGLRDVTERQQMLTRARSLGRLDAGVLLVRAYNTRIGGPDENGD